MITKFQQFLNEKLVPSQFRSYVKAFNRDRYKDIFEKYKELYSGDKNAYRIYLPLLGGDNPIKNEIEEFLKQKGFVDIDYIEGNCRYAEAKNFSKIGKILTKEKKDDLMKKFVEDPKRKAGNNLLVCISRHPYDIAGADTDRDWTDCMTMSSPLSSPRLKKHVDRLEEILPKFSDLKVKIKEVKDKIKAMKKPKKLTKAATKDPMLALKYKEDSEKYAKLVDQRDTMVDEYNKISIEKIQLDQEISNRKEAGCNVRFLLQDVKHGSLISYLIKETDKNINKPLAVLNIKPYINELDDKDIILVSDNNMYGERVNEFKKTVDMWLNSINLDKSGSYRLNPNLYADGKNQVNIFKEKDYEMMVDDIKEYIKNDQLRDNNSNNRIDKVFRNLRQSDLEKIQKYIIDTKTYNLYALRRLFSGDDIVKNIEDIIDYYVKKDNVSDALSLLSGLDNNVAKGYANLIPKDKVIKYACDLRDETIGVSIHFILRVCPLNKEDIFKILQNPYILSDNLKSVLNSKVITLNDLKELDAKLFNNSAIYGLVNYMFCCYDHNQELDCSILLKFKDKLSLSTSPNTNRNSQFYLRIVDFYGFYIDDKASQDLQKLGFELEDTKTLKNRLQSIIKSVDDIITLSGDTHTKDEFVHIKNRIDMRSDDPRNMMMLVRSTMHMLYRSGLDRNKIIDAAIYELNRLMHEEMRNTAGFW